MTSAPRVDDDELAQCVGCGLCLPHCPTYRVTADERFSPRGRIALMRDWIDTGTTISSSLEALDSCIQCVGCETACPSGVQYGHLISATRAAMDSTPHRAPLPLRLGLKVLSHQRILRVGSIVIGFAQRAHVVPRRLGLPVIPLRQPSMPVEEVRDPLSLREINGDNNNDEEQVVWFFQGCVMDAWSRRVHVDSVRVLQASGVKVIAPPRISGCCGALHEHAGLRGEARRLAEKVMIRFPGNATIVVNSAGCGAMLKEYGHMLGTNSARQFSARVRDIHEYLAEPTRLTVLVSRLRQETPQQVLVQDPCHLRHAQRVQQPVRDVLRTVSVPVDIPDDGLCCGAGGSYFLTHPKVANELRARKLAQAEKVWKKAAQASDSAPIILSANPGCAIHLANGGSAVEHPMSYIARHLVDHDTSHISREVFSEQ